MSNEAQQESPYDVLGVPRDADARAVKKAYFERVRQHPPETHPEAFKRLREAYELLSDPEARRAWDARAGAEDLDPTARRLQQATDLLDAGDAEGGRAVLTALLHEQPELHAARDLLGRQLLAEDRLQEALAQFELLVAQRPEDWRAHLHHGWALHRLERLHEAADACWRAKKRGPGELGPRVSLADVLEDLGQVPETLAQLAEALALPSATPMDVYALRVRRAALMLEHGVDAPARELDVLEAAAAREPDPELRRFACGQLASAAARLFARQKSEAANLLLERGRRLDPERATVEVAYPTRLVVDVAALPEAARAWLGEEAERLGARRAAGTWLGLGALALALGAATLLLLAYTFGSAEPRETAGWAACALLATGLAAPSAWAGRALVRAVESPLGRFTTVHPLHLVRVALDRVTVWPLVHLHDVQLVNHHTNGVYTHTALDLRFADRRTTVTVRGQQQAQELARELLGRRRRVLELLNRGMLDAEDAVELLPPALLARAGRKGRVRAERAHPAWRAPLAAAAAAALLVAAALPVQPRAVAERAWGLAANARDLGPTLALLHEAPDSRYAPAARARWKAVLDEARARVQERTEPAARPLLLALLDAAERHEGRQVVVRLAPEQGSDAVSFPRSAYEQGRIAREQQLGAAWQRLLDEAMGQGVLRVTVRPLPREGTPLATLDVRERLSGAPLPRLVWTVSAAGLEAAAPTLELEAAQHAMLTPTARAAPEALFHAWLDRWHLPGAGSRRPLLFPDSTLARKATP